MAAPLLPPRASRTRAPHPLARSPLWDAFGIKANPGTALAWRDVDADSSWVLNNSSAHYNQWRQGAQGGFDKKVSEHLISYPGEYAYAVVIDDNRFPVVKKKGGAIFLHVHGRGATAGCVSISRDNMIAFLNNADSGDTIIIH